MKIESDDIRTKEADDRGRLSLGTEYANKGITVAIMEVADNKPSEDELAAAYRNATESAHEITREFECVSDEAWGSLGPAPDVEGYNADDGDDE